jgi:hypothetical protein
MAISLTYYPLAVQIQDFVAKVVWYIRKKRRWG